MRRQITDGWIYADDETKNGLDYSSVGSYAGGIWSDMKDHFEKFGEYLKKTFSFGFAMLLFAVTCLAGLIWALGLVTSCFCPSRHGGPSALHVLLVPIKGIIRILLYIMKEVGLPVWQFRLPNINIFSRKPTWMTDLEGQRAGLPTRVVNYYSNASYRIDE